MFRAHIKAAFSIFLFSVSTSISAIPLDVVLFSGFQGSSGSGGDGPTGMEVLTDRLNDVFGGDSFDFRATYYEWEDVDNAVTEATNRDNSTIFIGHSLGGESARRAANQYLENGGTVSQLIQIDVVEYTSEDPSVFPLPDYNDTNNPNQFGVPDGVSAINYFQLQEEEAGIFDGDNYQGTRNVVGAQNINVEDIFFDDAITHRTIDDDGRVTASIFEEIRQVLFNDGFTAFSNSTVSSADLLANALVDLSADQGLYIVPGSAVFDGNLEEGSASFVKNLHIGDGLVIDNGILLTSGDGTPPLSNTETAYSGLANEVGSSLLDPIIAPYDQVTTDASSLSFEVRVNPEFDAISIEFAFGTEEYPDQGVIDIGAIFVNGVNYAQFPNGQPLSFTVGTPTSAQLIDNTGNTLNIEYDGITGFLTLVAPALTGASEVNNVVIAVSDSADTAFDSGLFVSNLKAIKLAGPDGNTGTSPADPLLPPPDDDPEDGFDIPVSIGDTGLGISTPLFIDPVFATGYLYQSFGPNFATVLIPSALPGGDSEFVIDFGMGLIDTLLAGVTYNILDLFPIGVSEFSILGINIEEKLDPTDPNAFVTGLTFVGGGDFTVKMTPITEQVDEPSIILLLLAGIVAVAKVNTRTIKAYRFSPRC